MARPTGWEVLGLDGDPTPGVVESVQALAKQLGDFAHDVEAAYRSLSSFGSDANALQWVGQTAEAFKGQFGPLPGRLQKLYVSYSEASDALSAYAPALQAAQSKADSALRQAQDADTELQRATTNANNAATDLKTAQQNAVANPNQQAVTNAQTAHDTAQTTLSNAKAAMAALTKQAHDAYNDRITAAQACAKALGHAQSDGIHNKHWWEHVGEFMSEWGGKIADIANDLAPFLDVLALATSWIPGVDVITAGLAEADNLVALVGTGMKVAGDTMQGHFGDALLGVGMLGLQFAGGKLLGKLGKEAEGETGAALTDGERSATREAEGNTRAVTAADPVDVVTGQMLTTDTDVVLPGILPLTLSRAYASGNVTGLRFGPGWSSTLDQRIAVNEGGIHFAGDDAQTLHYPLPAGDEEVLPERGPRWPLVWDRAADEIRVSDPWSGLTRRFPVVHHADPAGQIRDLTVVHDRNGNRIDILRTPDGTPVGVEHSGGYRIAVATVATAAGLRIAALRMPGDGDSGADTTLVEYLYDDRGRLTGIVNSSGLPFEYEYDDADRITGWTDRSGFRYSYAYDDAGRVVSSTGNGGFLSATFAYDPAGGLTTVTDALGHATVYHHDAAGHLDRVTDPVGGTTLVEYDFHGRVLSRTDALGHRTAMTYDERGDVVRVDHPDGTHSLAEYDDLHSTTLLVRQDGATWRHAYDERGNLVHSTDPAGAETRMELDEHGAVVAVTDALGHVTRLESDAAGLPVAVIGPDGAVTYSRRDRFGRITDTVHPSGAATQTTWTLEGRLLSSTGPDGFRQENVHNASGQVVRHVGPVGTTGFEYGPFGLVTSRTEPGGARYDFAYDAELRLTSVTGPSGLRWQYTYDAAGRLVSETDFGGRTLTYGHDGAGRLTRRTNGAGQESRMVRDQMGRIVERRTAEGVFGFVYDAVGRMTAAHSADSSLVYERDVLGRIVAETVDGRTVAHGYDRLGQAVSRLTPAGALSVWEFDAAGRPAGLSTGTGDLALRRDAAGREIARVLGPGAVLAQEHDATGRLVAQNLWTGDAAAGAEDAASAGGPSLWRRYSYRDDGTPDRISDSANGTRHYRTDTLGRVLSVTGASWNESYAYDALGNLRSAITPNTPDSAGDREYAATAVRRVGRTHYEQDAQGRTVRVLRRTLDGRQREWRYAWDSEDRLTEATLPDGTRWRYHYDPLGRRIGKSRLAADGSVAERVRFSWDGARLVEQESTGADGIVAVLTWDYEPDSMRPAAQRRRVVADQAAVDEAFHAIVTDLVGTPTELVAPDGSVEWALTTTVFGEPVAVTAVPGTDCPLRFPGQYRDAETGLSYNLNRYYDPAVGSYLSPDPLGLTPSPNDRGYVLNPLIWSDPLGLTPVSGGAERAAPGFVVGKNGAQDVRSMGRPDGELVLSGHGGIDPGDGSFVTVPPGTSIVMYTHHADTIYDWEGNAIETGVPHKRLGMPAAVEVFGPGEKLPDYWLSEPTGLHIEATPRNVTVTRPTRLSELLQPNQGTVHWAACRWVQP